MTTVVLKDVNVDRTMSIVRELRASGLIQGVDFDFEYCPAEYEYSWQPVSVRQTKFMFYNEKYATMFILRYASQK